MGAIFRSDGKMFAITPTANINAGDVVKVGAGLVGVAVSDIPANTTGCLNAYGEYDVTVEAGTEYAVGELVPCAAKTLAGESVTVKFGVAVKAVAATNTTARCRLIGTRPSAITDSTSGTAGDSLVAAASTAYTKDELAANFATIAAALNL